MKATKMVLAVAGIILGLVLLPSLAMADKTIGMLLFSGETRYNEAAQGIRDRLIESGFGGPGTVFIMENAAGNKARAAELVEQLRTKNPDLLATMGTNATMAAGDRIKDLPIVFSVVYDPVVSGIAKSWQGSGNNTAGVSSKVSLSKLIESLTALKPIARLAVLFTPAEQNSLAQLGDLKKLQTLTQARNTFEIVPVNISKLEEIQPRVADVLGKVDAVYITGSNLVDSQVEAIVDMANKARVITVSHLDDLVAKGVLLGVCANSYSMGQAAGEMSVNILKGAKPSLLPVAFAKKSDVILNMKTVRQGQFRIPANLMKQVTKKIE